MDCDDNPNASLEGTLPAWLMSELEALQDELASWKADNASLSHQRVQQVSTLRHELDSKERQLQAAAELTQRLMDRT